MPRRKKSKFNDPIHVYYDMIRNHDVVVSWKVERVYQEQVRIIEDKNSEWEYDTELANHAIFFVENYCKQSKGTFGGKNLNLEPWEKALVAVTFGIVHKITGLRKYSQVMLVVGRKNGKSTLASAIGLYEMIGDGELGSEVYACATKEDQAKIIWLEAKSMTKKSPVLLDHIKPLVKELNSEVNDSIFKPLGSDSDTLDGLNVQCGLLDEIHAWKTKDLYDVIVDGTAAREQPLIFITTTAGTIRESIYDILYEEAANLINGYGDPNGYQDDAFFPVIYELDSRSEWTNPKLWYKANPGLGTIKKLNILAAKVAKAKANPLLLKNLLCKDFCIRETTTEAWLSYDDLNNTATFDINSLKPRYGIGGVDLSATTDLTAAKMIFKVPDDPTIYVLSKYWLPEDLIEQRSREDHIPYDVWASQGFLEAVPGNRVHPKFITEWFKYLRDEIDIYPYYIGYDSWAADYWVDDMASEFGKENMIPVIQGKKTLSIPMHNMGADIKSKLINYNNNPIDKWCLSNTSVDMDRNGNIQPAKGKSRLKRIDGTASLLDAYTILYNKESEYMSII